MSAELINREGLDKTLAKAGEKEVVLDFFAPWCGPCQMVSPEFDAQALELKDSHLLVKINVDENKEFSQEYGVSSVPTIIKLEGSTGKELDRHVGYIDEESLKTFLKNK